MARPRLLVSLALVFAMASAGRAESLLTPVGRGARGLPAGVARGTTLALGRTALGELRGRASAIVSAFPLGDDRTADLALTRFDPFAPGARAEVVGPAGVRDLPLPDEAYFTGTVRGEATSRVFLAAGTEAVHGFVLTDEAVYVFGPDGAGGHRSYALRDADPTVWPPPGDFCANDLHPEQVASPTVNAQARIESGLVPPAFPVAGTSTLVQADVAVETDHELWAKFNSDSGTLGYLASLLAADTAIYERDVAVRLRFSYIRLWATTSDPWTQTSTSGQLNEVQSYWTNPANNMNAIAGAHDIVHFISGKSVQGGIAYIGSVCDPSYAFGVSQVFGSFDLSSPSQIWDVLVTTHEMGHNFGSPHTHCYNPPIDKCYNQEPGCYSGPVVASRGTIMSYCHLLAGGLSNIDLMFGPVVSSTIRGVVGGAACLAPIGSCGNGVLEPGEQCDDGNTLAGDGCSPSCQFEVCGNGALDPGETCDDGNTVSGDGCSATCQREPRCGNGLIDPGETCDDGNTISGDGCSATCQREPRCGDGVLDPGEQCDDGNNVSGDGCSAACKKEDCKVIRAGQTIWARSQMTIQHGGGAGRDRMSLHADFMIATPVSALSPPTTGAELLLEGAGGDTMVDAILPPGSRWSTRRGRWVYKDAAGSVAGIRKLEVVDVTRGGVPEVSVTVAGRNGSYPVTSGVLPVAVTIILGDDTSGLAGACGRHAFDASSCRGGARLVCR